MSSEKSGIHRRFQTRIKNLLEDAGFEITDCNYFKEGPDITAIAERHKIIVQCKYAEKDDVTYNRTQHLVDEYSTKVRDESADKAILAIGRYHIPEKYLDEETQKENLRKKKTVVWDDRLIKYYRRSAKALKQYAKYLLLGDLGIEKDFGKPISVPAFEVKMGENRYYVFTMSPRILLPISYVFRREGIEAGYQRTLKKRKLEDVGEFVGPENYFPNNVICVFTKKIDFNKSSGMLSIPRKYRSVWIVDGQHRLYGYAHASDEKTREEARLLCAGFTDREYDKKYGLSKGQQAKMFVDINDNATRISKALLLDLYESLGIKDRRVEVVKSLAEKSVFKGKIKFPRQKGDINLTTFATTSPTDLLLRKQKYGIISRWWGGKREIKKVPESYYVRILNDYFSLVKEVLSDKWQNSSKFILAKNRGIRALLRILEHILGYSNGLREKDKARECLKALKGIELRAEKLKGKYLGEAGADRWANEWIGIIQKKFPDFGPQAKTSQKVIEPEQKKEAEKYLKKQLSRLEGEVVGELMYVDPSTFEYLSSIPPRQGIRLIVHGIKSKDKCKEVLKKLSKDRPYIHVRKVDYPHPKKPDIKQAFIHERWLGGENYEIDIGTALKRQTLGKSKHTIQVIDFSDIPISPRRRSKFEEVWEADTATLEEQFGSGTKMEIFY